jgi:hypothetical protein
LQSQLQSPVDCKRRLTATVLGIDGSGELFGLPDPRQHPLERVPGRIDGCPIP